MRTHYCGELNKSHENKEVVLCGWAHRRRDHGGVIFIDLRDHSGILQVVVEPDNAEAFKIAEGARYEYCLHVKRQLITLNQDIDFTKETNAFATILYVHKTAYYTYVLTNF